MPRRPRKNWPLPIGVSIVLLLLAVYITLPLLGSQSQDRGQISWGPSPVERAAATLTGVWFFVFGATIGSFLNVVAYRLPLRLTLVSKPSRCPYCLRPILFRHNVPILGWLILRGRCRVCRLPISPRYPLVELLVACIFLSLFCAELASGGTNLPVRTPRPPGVMWNVLSPKWDLIRIYFYHCFLLSVMVVCALLRIDKQSIPRRLLTFAVVVGLGVPLVWPDVSIVPWTTTRPAWLTYGPPWSRLDTPLLGMIVGLAVGSLMYFLVRFDSHKGSGEASFHRDHIAGSSLIGMFLGWQAVVPTLLLTVVVQIGTLAIGHLIGRRGNGHLWSTNTVFGTCLFLCIWRPLSSATWTPGAASSPVAHGLWFVAAMALLGVTMWFVRGESTTEPDGLDHNFG